MGVRIMIDLAQVRPVFGGKWHMTRLSRLPDPGEPITTLCGITEPADYTDQKSQVTVTTCWDCDLEYRRAHDLPWYGSTHPALRGQAQHRDR